MISLNASIINVDKNISNEIITQNVDYFIDDTQKFTFDDIENNDNLFKKFTKPNFNFGYIVNSNLWVKLIFSNNTKDDITKVISYSNAEVSEYFLYKKNHGLVDIKKGLLHSKPNITNLHKYFRILVPSNTTQSYYIFISSTNSSTNGNLKIWDEEEFKIAEIKHMLILSAFFSAMIVLLLYNIILYFFSRDKVYLYYVFYVIFVSLLRSFNTGFFYTFIDVEIRLFYTNDAFSIFVVNGLLVSFILFIKIFLNTKQYKKTDVFLDFIIYIGIFIIIYFSIFNNFILMKYNVFFCGLTIIYIFLIAIYSVYKKNPNGYYFLIALGMVNLAFIIITIQALGIYPLYNMYPYSAEGLFLLESILFSIILSKKLKTLTQDKYDLKKELYQVQETENIRLNKEVLNQTFKLKELVEIKEYLLTELHHRVKNNIHIIITFINIQSQGTQNKETKKTLEDIKNKIYAMSKVHEILLFENKTQKIDTEYYFDDLCCDIIQSYSMEVDINITITCHTQLDEHNILYVGLIVNELLVNACKYAFIDKTNGKFDILLEKDDDKYILIVKDDGIGFDFDHNSTSKGLLILKILVEQQLKGTLDIKNNNGTKITIRF